VVVVLVRYSHTVHPVAVIWFMLTSCTCEPGTELSAETVTWTVPGRARPHVTDAEVGVLATGVKEIDVEAWLDNACPTT
jgi:hypothetical protein